MQSNLTLVGTRMSDILRQQTSREAEKDTKLSVDSQIHHNHLCLQHHKRYILKFQKQGLNKFPFGEESTCVAASGIKSSALHQDGRDVGAGGRKNERKTKNEQ